MDRNSRTKLVINDIEKKESENLRNNIAVIIIVVLFPTEIWVIRLSLSFRLKWACKTLNLLSLKKGKDTGGLH